MYFPRQSAARKAMRAAHLTALAFGVVLLLPIGRGFAAAADSPDNSTSTQPTASADPNDLQTLQQELEKQKKQLQELEQRIQADEAAQTSASHSATANPNALTGSFGPDGFTLASADGLNVLRLEGNLSLDYRTFPDSYNATDDTWLVRKARPIFEGTFDGMFDFRLMPDFGLGKSLLQDAWVDARVQPWLVFEVGKFKAPVGLERLQLEQYARFIEASLTADLLPYRDLGFMALGDLGHGVLDYQFAMLDGAPDGGSTDANSTPDANSTGKFTYDARGFLHPFAHVGFGLLEKLGLGVAGTYVNYVGTATTSATTSLLTTYKTTGQQSFFSFRSDSAAAFNNATIADGIERRIVPQFNYYYRMFGLLGEYVKADQQVARELTASTSRYGTLDNSAWEVQGYVFLTGENEAYADATPLHPVGQGGFGALELVARVHALRFGNEAFIDGSSSFASPSSAVEAAHAVGVGLNWYLTYNFKLQLDYEVSHFEDGAATGDRPEEKVLTSQFALIF